LSDPQVVSSIPLPLSNTCGPLSSIRRSFIVQLGEEADLIDGRVGGRVEHLRTGEARHFESLETLLAFFNEALTLDRRDAAVAATPVRTLSDDSARRQG
jgi:hypothetical protein